MLVAKTNTQQTTSEIIEGERVFETDFPLFSFFVGQDNTGQWVVVEYLSGYPVCETGDEKDDVIIEAYSRLKNLSSIKETIVSVIRKSKIIKNNAKTKI